LRGLIHSQAEEQAALLGETTRNVLVTAHESAGPCPGCQGPMRVRKTRVRQGRTLAHGTFRIHGTERVCQAGCCHPSQIPRRSGDLEAVLLPRSSVGYDVMVFIGLQRYLIHQQREEIREALSRDYGVFLSSGEISRLGRLFLTYLENLHRRRRERIRAAFDRDGGWPLHIDATGEDGRGTLLVLYAGWRKWVLGAFKIPTEHAEAIRPCIENVVAWAGPPVAIVRDLGRAMIPACESFRNDKGGQFPILSCHYHFLSDVGKDLLEAGHGELRALFQRFDIRPDLRKLVRDLGRKVGEEIPHVRREVLSWQGETGNGHRLPDGLQGQGVVRALAQWTLDYAIESSGEDFPFVLPYLDFYHRCIVARRAIDAFLRKPPADPDVLRALNRLARILDTVRSEVPFKAVTGSLRQRQRLFRELRGALRLREKSTGHGSPPATEPTDVKLKDIQQDVEDLRSSLERRRPQRGPAQEAREAIDVVLDHLTRYGESLWGHIVALPEKVGGGIRLVERTNDILENFFRGMKHGERRRSGRKILTQDFETLPPAAALVPNLNQPDYVEVLCGSLGQLPQTLAALDAEDLERRFDSDPRLQVDASSHTAAHTDTASLSIEDRRVIRTNSMTQKIFSAARSKAPKTGQLAASAG